MVTFDDAMDVCRRGRQPESIHKSATVVAALEIRGIKDATPRLLFIGAELTGWFYWFLPIFFSGFGQ